MGHSIGTVTEEADADAFPIATFHREGVTGREKGFAISAVEVLVAVLFAVVCDLEIETCEGALLDRCAMAVLLDENAVFSETDASKQLARAEETGIAVASGFDYRSALALIADDFLCEHVSAEFETVGRLGMDRQETRTLVEAPVGVVRVVVPLPLEADGIGEIVGGAEGMALVQTPPGLP